MNGRVVGCLRVGALAAGPHQVVIDQVLIGRNGSAVAGLTTTVPSTPGGKGSAGPAVALTLSPASGTPGSRVTVNGHLASPIPRDRRSRDANLCWDGCRDGLQYTGVQLRWISPTTFRADLIVPDAPWIEAGPDRVLQLVSGTYPIGVQCLELLSGCALGSSEGNADFSLRGPSSGIKPWCRTAQSCAHLVVSPRAALPGDVVRVTGDAPLVSVLGSNHPFTFQLQVLRGSPRGPAVSFSGRGNVILHLGDGALTVEAPPTWEGLTPIVPVVELAAGLPAISANPAAPSVVAWCGNGVVNVTGPGGQTQIATASAATALEQMGFVGFGASPPTCDTALPAGAGGSRESPQTVVAAFVVAPHGESPPTADVALRTSDDGVTWEPLPVPPGASPAGFGGFRFQGGVLEALFAPVAPGVQPLVEASPDGGQHWSPAPLGCPTDGPCVTLAAWVPGNCAAIGTTQALLVSTDGGQHWRQAGWPGPVDACAPAELVATSARTELLVDSGSPYTLSISTDGGVTWAYIAIPALPGEQPDAGLGPGPGGIIVLPNGALLATGQRGNVYSWELLEPGAGSWCSARGVQTGVQQSTRSAPVVVVGTQIWWLTGSEQPPSEAQHLDVADLSC